MDLQIPGFDRESWHSDMSSWKSRDGKWRLKQTIYFHPQGTIRGWDLSPEGVKYDRNTGYNGYEIWDMHLNTLLNTNIDSVTGELDKCLRAIDEYYDRNEFEEFGFKKICDRESKLVQEIYQSIDNHLFVYKPTHHNYLLVPNTQEEPVKWLLENKHPWGIKGGNILFIKQKIKEWYGA